MKIKTSLLTVFVVMLIASCTKSPESGLDYDNHNNNSCQVILTPQEMVSISFDEPKEIPETVLFNMISDFINAQPERPQTRSTSQMNFNIKSKSYVVYEGSTVVTRSGEATAEKNLVPVYEIMVKDGAQSSFVLVSSDERAPGVLAYFPNFPTSEKEIEIGLSNINTKTLLALSKAQLHEDVDKVEKIKERLREQTVEKICTELNIPIENYLFEEVVDKIGVIGDGNTITRATNGYQTIPTQITAYRLPMTNFLWDQYPPYNRAFPEDDIVLPCDYYLPNYGHVPVGCTTIAVALIESIIQRPVVCGLNINWSYLRQFPEMAEANPDFGQNPADYTPIEALNMAGNMLRAINVSLGSWSPKEWCQQWQGNYVQATYASYGSSFTYISQNMLCDSPRSFDPDIALASLQQGRPVLLEGYVYGDDGPGTPWVNVGHVFVIDGYVIARKNTSTGSAAVSSETTRANIVLNNDMYWHVNLGWGGESVAYFKLDADTKCKILLDDAYGRGNEIQINSQTMVANIRKK